MLLAAVIGLEALEPGVLGQRSAVDVHGFWFRRWQRVAPAMATYLHDGSQQHGYTLSPVLGLPDDDGRSPHVAAGQAAWFRAASLEDDLSRAMQQDWLPGLPDMVRLGGLRWRIIGWTDQPEQHPWAGAADPQALADHVLLDAAGPNVWEVLLRTPVAFHGQRAHFPVPLPDLMVRSWHQRWERFGPVRLPDDLPERTREAMAISAYQLETQTLHRKRSTFIGAVGWMRWRSLGLSEGERRAIDLLARYAFWAGSGHHTSQGMGLTCCRAEEDGRGRSARSGAAV